MPREKKRKFEEEGERERTSRYSSKRQKRSHKSEKREKESKSHERRAHDDKRANDDKRKDDDRRKYNDRREYNDRRANEARRDYDDRRYSERYSDSEEEERNLTIDEFNNKIIKPEWEKYTNSIGSQLLQKMGYVPGKGLGKNLQGKKDIISLEMEFLPANSTRGLGTDETEPKKKKRKCLTITNKSLLDEKCDISIDKAKSAVDHYFQVQLANAKPIYDNRQVRIDKHNFVFISKVILKVKNKKKKYHDEDDNKNINEDDMIELVGIGEHPKKKEAEKKAAKELLLKILKFDPSFEFPLHYFVDNDNFSNPLIKVAIDLKYQEKDKERDKQTKSTSKSNIINFLNSGDNKIYTPTPLPPPLPLPIVKNNISNINLINNNNNNNVNIIQANKPLLNFAENFPTVKKNEEKDLPKYNTYNHQLFNHPLREPITQIRSFSDRNIPLHLPKYPQPAAQYYSIYDQNVKINNANAPIIYTPPNYSQPPSYPYPMPPSYPHRLPIPPRIPHYPSIIPPNYPQPPSYPYPIPPSYPHR